MSVRSARATFLIAAALGGLLSSAPAAAQTPVVQHGGAKQDAGPTPAEVSAIRKATERFRDVRVALAEGYLPDPTNMCVTSEMEGLPRQLGGMGVHYFRPDLLAITGTSPRVNGTGTHTDFLRPGVLIYEPQADGSMQLVAVENLVFAKAWKDAGNTAPPSFHGNDYYHMVDNPNTPADEAHGFEPHYELHFWLYRDNPAGAFMPFNARVGCQHHKGGAHASH